MNRSRLTAVAAAVLLALLLASGVRGAASVPPLGALLDPWGGIWAVAREVGRAPTGEVRLPGLSDPVSVRIDDRGVPHIFASSDEDAVRALGWLVARDRLFQLELQTRATAGRLTELVGPAALEVDRRSRAWGLAWAAERSWSALDPASAGVRMATAYAEGVNAWIDALDESAYPLEYRILRARPMRWEPVHSLYLMARMGLTLAWSDSELDRARTAALVGRAAAEALLPLHNPIQEPIQPNGEPGPRRESSRLPPPGLPDSTVRLAAALASQAAALLSASGGVRDGSGDALGSNNWAVAPRRTAAGHALLAGDPHLDLSLPSLWYEAHLQVPGRLDVAGVTIPGSPGIIIGFNRDVAWSFTNTGGDVLDWYRESVDDVGSPSRYRMDDTWHDLTLHPTAYRGPRGDTLAVDTLRHTHRGPLVRVDDAWLSLRWTVHDTSRETEVFAGIARARSVEEWLEAMEPYVAPTQNGLVADRFGTIAIRSTGRYPIRPAGARGDTVLDGTRSAHDWQGSLPVSRYPFSLNPAQGFLASANQEPVDPLASDAYYGSNWVAPWRALHLNALLRADSAVTPATMARWQTDPGSARVAAFLPFFLRAAEAAERDGTADSTLRRSAELLGEWDGRYTVDNERAVLFELAMQALVDLVWDELVPEGSTRPVTVPDGAVLRLLLDDAGSVWWDRRGTPEVETRDEVLAAGLRQGLETAVRRHGDPTGGGWRWSGIRHANIHHLLRIPALSALGLPVQSGPSTLAPSGGSGTHGASWRMVVELGPEVRAWGIYPGGQSGNPASPRYADRIPRWQAGQLDTLFFPRTPDEIPSARTLASFTFVPAR